MARETGFVKVLKRSRRKQGGRGGICALILGIYPGRTITVVVNLGLDPQSREEPIRVEKSEVRFNARDQ